MRKIALFLALTLAGCGETPEPSMRVGGDFSVEEDIEAEDDTTQVETDITSPDEDIESSEDTSTDNTEEDTASDVGEDADAPFNPLTEPPVFTVTLTWEGEADLDLHILNTPAATDADVYCFTNNPEMPIWFWYTIAYTIKDIKSGDCWDKYQQDWCRVATEGNTVTIMSDFPAFNHSTYKYETIINNEDLKDLNIAVYRRDSNDKVEIQATVVVCHKKECGEPIKLGLRKTDFWVLGGTVKEYGVSEEKDNTLYESVPACCSPEKDGTCW